MMTTYHEPVLLKESVDALNVREDGVYVDATFGGGGHATEILKRLGKKGRLLVIDRDLDAMRNFSGDSRCVFVRHNYRYLYHFIRYYSLIPIDGLLADLGISSHQIDEAARGFSFRFDAPLDMRMSHESRLTAATILNSYSEEELVRIFSSYGEVSNSKTLARKVIQFRAVESFQTINQFKEAVTPIADRGNESQYLAKVFQALRIEVNDELGSLKEMLTQCIRVIRPGGRLSVITYHSLEDRIVKNFIGRGRFEGEPEKDMFGNMPETPFMALNKKPIEAQEEEIASNPRSRSAKLRIAERRMHDSQ
jgi:16S rRNA (cytosine1402-N4)-methyltransferase